MMGAAEFDTMATAMKSILDQIAASPTGRLLLKDAAYIAGISEAQMRKRCEENRYGMDVGGYGFKNGGHWEVVVAPFVNSLPVSALPRFRDINRAWIIG